MTDALTDAALAHIKGLEALRADNEKLRTALAEAQHAGADIKVEVELLRRQFAEVSAERDFFMRYTTELVTKLNTVGSLITETLTLASQEAYKPAPKAAAPALVTDLGLEAPPAVIPGYG